MEPQLDRFFDGKFQGKPVQDCILKLDKDNQVVLCSDNASMMAVSCSQERGSRYHVELGFKYSHSLAPRDRNWQQFVTEIKYKEDEMFKVGDKAKVIKACWDYPTDKVGRTAKVLKEDGEATLCEFGFVAPAFHNGLGSVKGKPNHCYWMKTECLKKISRKSKATPKSTRKATRKPRALKVGDTVRLIKEYERSGMVGELAVIKEERTSNRFGIEFIKEMPEGRGHVCSGVCKLGHGWNVPKDCVELVTKSKRKVKEELAIDPRKFYKVLRIDGSPANSDARATGFKYTLPVDGKTEWTPTIDGIVTCRKGYHVIDAEHIKMWLCSYYGDLIVCEAKARGEMKSESDKYVAQSIQLTKILCRWNDVKKVFEKERESIKQEAQKLDTASYAEHEKRHALIWNEADTKEKDAFNKLIIGG